MTNAEQSRQLSSFTSRWMAYGLRLRLQLKRWFIFFFQIYMISVLIIVASTLYQGWWIFISSSFNSSLGMYISPCTNFKLLCNYFYYFDHGQAIVVWDFSILFPHSCLLLGEKCGILGLWQSLLLFIWETFNIKGSYFSWNLYIILILIFAGFCGCQRENICCYRGGLFVLCDTLDKHI